MNQVTISTQIKSLEMIKRTATTAPTYNEKRFIPQM